MAAITIPLKTEHPEVCLLIVIFSVFSNEKVVLNFFTMNFEITFLHFVCKPPANIFYHSLIFLFAPVRLGRKILSGGL